VLSEATTASGANAGTSDVASPETLIEGFVLPYPKFSLYNQFMKANVRRVKASNPSLTHRDAFKITAEAWKTSPQNPKNSAQAAAIAQALTTAAKRRSKTATKKRQTTSSRSQLRSGAKAEPRPARIVSSCEPNPDIQSHIDEAVGPLPSPNKIRVELVYFDRTAHMAWYGDSNRMEIEALIKRKFGIPDSAALSLLDCENDELVLSPNIPSGQYTVLTSKY